MIDLHTHSNQSDGTESPEQLVESAMQSGLTTIALTDHDTTAGLARAERRAQDLGIEVVRGIELSARQDGRSVHVLGYFIDPNSTELQSLLSSMQDSRRERAKEIVSRLSRDFPIAWEQVELLAGNAASVGRPHIADVLVTLGAAPDRPSAFERFLHESSPYVVQLNAIPVSEAIRTLRAAGGAVTIAHPWGSKRGTGRWTIDHFADWASYGLAGIEVWHREHSVIHRRMLLGIADRLGLVATGGSDYHGAGKPNMLGEHTTSLHTLECLRTPPGEALQNG